MYDVTVCCCVYSKRSNLIPSLLMWYDNIYTHVHVYRQHTYTCKYCQYFCSLTYGIQTCTLNICNTFNSTVFAIKLSTLCIRHFLRSMLTVYLHPTAKPIVYSIHFILFFFMSSFSDHNTTNIQFTFRNI